MNDDLRIVHYLGNKTKIINEIKEEISNITSQGEYVVDLFSGSGVVAQNLAENFIVIANDVQNYSKIITSVLLKRNLDKFQISSYSDLINSESYIKNKEKLCDLFRKPLEYEQKILGNSDYEGLASLCECGVFYNGKNLNRDLLPFIKEVFGESLNLFTDKNLIEVRKNQSVYMLFTLYFSNGYFSLEQCIEIDSLRCAIDNVNGMNFNEDVEKQVLVTCLIHSISQIVSSVGKNFAQPIKIKDKNGKVKTHSIVRCMRDRKMKIDSIFNSIYSKLLRSNKIISDENIAYCLDSIEVFNNEIVKKAKTFYLDPPYTIDHYSRFYHVLETLIKYDYPEMQEKIVNGKSMLMNGRYRNDRFQSKFSIQTEGQIELEKVISKIYDLKANLVLSYSESDISKMTRSRVINKERLMQIIYKYYKNVKVLNLDHRYRKLSNKLLNKVERMDGELLIVCQYK